MSNVALAGTSRPVRVYIVDDEPLIHNVWRRLLRGGDFELRAFVGARDALGALGTDADVDVVVTDLAMPEMDGLELLRAVKALRPEIEVVVMTAHVGLEKAIAAVKQGAYHFLAKPFDVEQPALIVRQAAERKRARAATLRPFPAITRTDVTLVGQSAEARRLLREIEGASRVSSCVLVTGEHGSGKEAAARAIHAGSPRRERPFLVVSCASLDGALLEGELFGFPSAAGARVGALEAAAGGTVLIDEVGKASLAVQTKLLRTLERGEIRPVGAREPTRVDTRIMATTTASLDALARQGRFRDDLIHRLGAITIAVPALRARREDVPELARHFLRRGGLAHGREVSDFDADALEALCGWTWPGNARELENTVERAVITGRGGTIALSDLPKAIIDARPRAGGEPESYGAARRRAMEAFDRAFVERMLARAGGNISEAARLAGLDRANFRRIMRRVTGPK